MHTEVKRQGFVQSPLHPETEWSACTGYSDQAAAVNAIIDYPLRDASICRGPDGSYYLTGTTGQRESRSHGIMLWKSRDLADWEPLGLVWSVIGDGRRAEAGGPKSVLSPEIHYVRGAFWIAFGTEEGGTALLRSTTGAPEGPYADPVLITLDGHDASLFEDDDGIVYWVYQDGKVARLKSDMSGLAEEPRQVYAAPYRTAGRIDKASRTGDCRIGASGAFLLKRGGQYFMFCADANSRMGEPGTDTFVAVSGSVYGPYSRRYLAVPNGGQATFFQDGEGLVHAAFSGCGVYSPVDNRPAIVPMEFPQGDFIRPSASVILEKGAVASLKPLADIPIRDTFICVGPDGTYYMTGTSDQPNRNFWDGNDELHLWTSRDLEAWTYMAKVWDLHLDCPWAGNIREKPCLWAPEMIFVHGTFWITYSLQGGGTGLLKSLSGKADGPYADMGRMTNTDIDSSLFQDEDGSVYFVWQDGKIARMKPDMSGFAEEPRFLMPVDGIRVGYEGAFVVRYRGKYILGAAEWNGDERVDGTYDLMYSVADSLFGPYSPRRVAVPHGGHGTMFIDRQGRLMSTLFGNDRTAPFRTRPGIVMLDMRIGADGETRIRPIESGSHQHR